MAIWDWRGSCQVIKRFRRDFELRMVEGFREPADGLKVWDVDIYIYICFLFFLGEGCQVTPDSRLGSGLCYWPWPYLSHKP